jgi:hypothetical protein
MPTHLPANGHLPSATHHDAWSMIRIPGRVRDACPFARISPARAVSRSAAPADAGQCTHRVLGGSAQTDHSRASSQKRPSSGERDRDDRARAGRQRCAPTDTVPRYSWWPRRSSCTHPWGHRAGRGRRDAPRDRQHVISPACWDDFGTVQRYDDVTVPGPCNRVARPALCVREVADRRSPDEYREE